MPFSVLCPFAPIHSERGVATPLSPLHAHPAHLATERPQLLPPLRLPRHLRQLAHRGRHLLLQDPQLHAQELGARHDGRGLEGGEGQDEERGHRAGVAAHLARVRRGFAAVDADASQSELG